MQVLKSLVIVLLCSLSCEATFKRTQQTPAPRTPEMRRPQDSCATTEICYDPATSRMKAEWSGINLGLESGGVGARGPPGPEGPAGPMGPPGDPGVVSMDVLRNEIKGAMESYGKTTDKSEPSVGDSDLEARVSKVERALNAIAVGMNGKGKPKIKADAPLVLPDGKIDILGWVPAPNRYHYFISGNVDYGEAKKFCELRNSTLAMVGIRDPEIKKFLLNDFIRKRGVTVWIGLSDKDKEGDWYWEDGVKSTMYNTEWSEDQPDDQFQREDCGYMSRKSGKIADARCNIDLRALCER